MLKIIGGWGVRLNQFSIILRENTENVDVVMKEKLWKEQSYWNSKRTKEIATIDISKSGNYEIIFVNPYNLEVKNSNLTILNFLANKISSKDIEIVFV